MAILVSALTILAAGLANPGERFPTNPLIVGPPFLSVMVGVYFYLRSGHASRAIRDYLTLTSRSKSALALVCFSAYALILWAMSEARLQH